MSNSFARWCFLALLFVPLATSSAWAQTFTGGVRGVVSDSGGVVPGVTVTLINEATGATRDAVSNDRGQYDFSAVPPAVYTIKAELTGFKTYENKGIRVGTQQFVTMDIRLDVGQLQETITVTGDAPLIETSNASTGAVIDSQQLETLPSGGRSAFPVCSDRADRRGLRRPAVQPPEDQTNASLLSLGGGTGAATITWWTACRSPTCATERRRIPRSKAIEGVNVQVHQYDAETGRTGGGTFNVATKSGRQRLARQRFLPDPAQVGNGEQLLLRARQRADSRHLFPSWRRRFWRSRCQEPHVLLVCDRELRIEQPRETARFECRPRLKSGATSRRPSTAPAVRS
jgi:hypothetical protein